MRRRSDEGRASTYRRSSSTVSRTPALTRCAFWASFIHREIQLHGHTNPEREARRTATDRQEVEGMKLRITFAAVAALALVVVAAAFAGSDGKAAKAARGSAAIACGTTRTIGVAAPITGPAASIGQQQLR